MYKYYYLFNESPKVFWTPNSEYKPSAELFATYTDWRQMDKCPINYVDDFRITTILPKNIKTQMLCIEDEEIGFKKYYHLNKINKEMVGGFEYEGTLDVWCTYTLDFIKKLTATPTKPGNAQPGTYYYTHHHVYVERFLNNTLYNSEYLRQKAWMKDDPYFDFENYEYYAAGMSLNHFGFNKTYYNEPQVVFSAEVDNPNIMSGTIFNTWKIKTQDYTGRWSNSLVTYLTNKMKLPNLSRCKLAVFQETEGMYTCFILPPSETKFTLWAKENGNGREVKKEFKISNDRLTLHALLNLAKERKKNNNVQQPSYWANKLVGVYGSPIFVNFLKFGHSISFNGWESDQKKNSSNLSLNIQTGVAWDWGSDDNRASYTFTTLYFQIRPDEIRQMVKSDDDEGRGWYPTIFVPVDKFNTEDVDMARNKANVYYRYLDPQEYTDNQYGGKRWYEASYSISRSSTGLNYYLLGRAKFNGTYLNPSPQVKRINRKFPLDPGNNFYYMTISGMFYWGSVGFDGLNWWGQNAMNDPQLWKSRGTMNIATNKYTEYLLQTSASMNTGLMVAQEQKGFNIQKATLAGVTDFAGAFGSALSGDWGDVFSGVFGGASKMALGIENAKMTYRHTNAQVQAQLVDKRNSSKAKMIMSNVEADDKEQKLLLNWYDNPDNYNYEIARAYTNWLQDDGKFYGYISDIHAGNLDIDVLYMITKLPYKYGDCKFFNNVLWEVGMYGDFYTSPSRAFRKETLKFSYDQKWPNTNKFIFFKGRISDWAYKSFEPNLPLTIIEAMKTIFDSGVRIWETIPRDGAWLSRSGDVDAFHVVCTDDSNYDYLSPEGGVMLLPEHEHGDKEEIKDQE